MNNRMRQQYNAIRMAEKLWCFCTVPLEINSRSLRKAIYIPKSRIDEYRSMYGDDLEIFA